LTSNPLPTALFTHPLCLQHDTGSGHPERAERLQAVLAALEALPLARHEAPQASEEQILRVHTRLHLEKIRNARPGPLDADTTLSPHSYEAALRAAGAVCAAVDAVTTGVAGNAFCAVRPPGHHAEVNRAMGFCLFNNVAIGALHARAAHGLQKVAVLDFDVHHGNGTEEVAWDDPDFFFASTHQWPHYPGSGAAGDRGGSENIHNIPLEENCGSARFRQAWQEQIFPRLLAFSPAIILISAGFDAHAADPLGSLGLTAEDFGHVTAEIVKIAGKTCGGRLVSTLEGGYNLAALAESALAHVNALRGQSF
jgi:acetoin utilization deacetylase AcuC-like enzyme